MKISFDFDSTLAEDRIQKVCKKFLQTGHDVYVTTTRHEYMKPGIRIENRDLYRVCSELGIPKENIRFTNGSDKWRYLKGFDMHFDDDRVEIELMEENELDCAGILILDI